MQQFFDDDTPPELRRQILTYQMSQCMTDRERARLLGLPEGCRIRENAKILAPEKFICGRNVWIGEGAVLDAQGGLTIGDYSQIGLNCMVWTHSSHKQALISETCVSREGIVYKPTSIGNNCFIAGPSVIAAGVTIGDRVLVSPFSFVEKDLPSDTVYSERRSRRELERELARVKKITQELLELIKESKIAPAERIDALASDLASLTAKK